MNNKRLVLISAIGLLLLPGCNAPRELSAPKVTDRQLKPQLTEGQMRQLIESIAVRVMAGEYGGGSGVLIRKDGQVYTVLTNEHVVKPSKPHRIRTPDGKEYPAEIIKVREHGYDMAILQFAADADYEVVTLASSPGKVPQPVFAAGFPYDSRDLLITKGEFSMFPSQAMLDGYQIGYTNNVRQGMSGGPVLNAEGKLIGINGMSAYPILQDAYEFADGSYPSDELRKEMNRLSWGVPIQRLAEVDPSLEELLRPSPVTSRLPGKPGDRPTMRVSGVRGERATREAIAPSQKGMRSPHIISVGMAGDRVVVQSPDLKRMLVGGESNSETLP
ncbi:MAG: serine protease [Hormoscilla sp.]